MKLWLISQTANNNYDTYDSAVVVAPDEETAKHASPDDYHVWKDGAWHSKHGDGTTKPVRVHDTWTMPENVKVALVGDAAEGLVAGQVVCASFNAG